MIKLRGIEPRSNPDSKKSPYRTLRWFQSHPQFYMAPSSADLFRGVRMAEWLRTGLWKVLTIKLHGIEPGQILITKKAHRGGMELKLRPLVTKAGIDQILNYAKA
jgi:hypothetical protein